METLKFKTNIMCRSCLAAVTPILNQIDAIRTWNVDITVPSKTLTIETDEADMPGKLEAALKPTSYRIDQL